MYSSTSGNVRVHDRQTGAAGCGGQRYAPAVRRLDDRPLPTSIQPRNTEGKGELPKRRTRTTFNSETRPVRRAYFTSITLTTRPRNLNFPVRGRDRVRLRARNSRARIYTVRHPRRTMTCIFPQVRYLRDRHATRELAPLRRQICERLQNRDTMGPRNRVHLCSRSLMGIQPVLTIA